MGDEAPAYAASAVAVVHPANTADGSDGVARLCARLRVPPETVLSFRRREESELDAEGTVPSFAPLVQLPARCTLRELVRCGVRAFLLCRAHVQTSAALNVQFSWYLDVLAVPRRSFLEAMACFAADTEQREKCAWPGGDFSCACVCVCGGGGSFHVFVACARGHGRLSELCSSSGAALYHDYCVRARRSYVDVLEDFGSVDMPLASLVEAVPPLRPRCFSVASACARRGPLGGGAPRAGGAAAGGVDGAPTSGARPRGPRRS